MKIVELHEVTDGVFRGKAVSRTGRQYDFATSKKQISVSVDGRAVLVPPSLRTALWFFEPQLRGGRVTRGVR